MSFRMVPKSVTLNYLEQRNVPYFSLFHRICVRYVVVKQLLGIPQFQNLLLIVYDHIHVCLHDAAGCATGCTIEQPVVQPV